MKKETLLSDYPPVIGNYLKEIHLARWEENLTRDSNAPKTRIHVLKEVLDYLNQAKKPRHWFPWENGLSVDEKFWQSLVARDATSRGFLTLSEGNQAMSPVDVAFQAKAADCAIFSPYYYNLPMLYNLGDWIVKDITYPVGWADIETIQAWGNPIWTGVSDVLLTDPVLKHIVPCLDTRVEDKDTRGNTRDRKASREGENHIRESASILHEFYNDIGKLGLE
ncbi:hypothetical protein Tco_0114975 [Tanacetum coccineum]